VSIYFVLALNLLSGASIQAGRVVLTLYALELGAQPLTIGMLAATFSAFPVLLAVKVGKLSDRFGDRWLLIFGAAAGSIGLLTPAFFHGLPFIFIAGVMNGLCAVFFFLLTQNLVGILSDPQHRARNFSNFSLTNAIFDFVGPLFAGFSIDHSGHAATCLYLAVLALVPLVMLVIWGGMLPGGTPHVTRARGGILSLMSERGVRRTLVTSSLQNTGDSLYQFYMPVYAHAVGLSASAIGVILAMYPAAAFAMRLVLMRLLAKLKEERLLSFAFFVGAASLFTIPFFKRGAILALISFMFGLGMGCCGPIVTMLMFGNAPRGRSGEALGLKMTVNHFTKVVIPMVFGSIASAYGLSPVFWINAIMLGTGGYLSYPKKEK